MEVSIYGQNLLRSTCCHLVHLEKDGMKFLGIYNGLASWGRVEDGKGVLVEQCSTEWEEPQDENDTGYSPNFNVSDFAVRGYLTS